jgi:hypothetical protein
LFGFETGKRKFPRNLEATSKLAEMKLHIEGPQILDINIQNFIAQET